MSGRARVRNVLLAVIGATAVAVPVALGPVGSATGATVAASVAAPNCGTAVYLRPNGTRYQCVFADYFSGTSLDTSKWQVLSTAANHLGNKPDCWMNSRNNILESNGVLRLITRTGLAPFTCGSGSSAYTATSTSATVSTMGKFNLRLGRVEVRAKFPFSKQHGLQTSLWMWPTNGAKLLPPPTEIDFAEWYSQWYDRVIPYLHNTLALIAPKSATNDYCMVDNVGAWHTYVLDWTAGRITISYDGKTCLVNNAAGNFNQPFFLLLTQMLGVGKNSPTAATPKVATAQFDYVRMWS
jgi:beta-glucanase (GH16 family)